MDRPQTFTKVDLTPRRHHGYAFVLFLLGTLFPPLAVAARFGIGRDFFINLVLTICGYIPGHVHNFYIQNIRNNKNHRRTPKWASRYGLVDTSEIERKKKKSQWANRYNDRLPRSTLEGRDYEDGQVPGQPEESISENGRHNSQNDGLWTHAEESYYGQHDPAGSTPSFKTNGSAGRWHYPANFSDAEAFPTSGKRSKVKRDRWARTEDARMGVGLEDGHKKKKKRKDRAAQENSDFIDPSRIYSEPSSIGGAEGLEAVDNGPRRNEATAHGERNGDGLDHQF